MLPNIIPVNHNFFPFEIGSFKRNILHDLLHHCMEPAGPNILGDLINPFGDLGYFLDGFFREVNFHAFGGQKSFILFDQSILGLGQNPDEILPGERRQFHSYGKPSLQLGN